MKRISKSETLQFVIFLKETRFLIFKNLISSSYNPTNHRLSGLNTGSQGVYNMHSGPENLKSPGQKNS